MLPEFNLGSFSGASCAAALTQRIERLCDATGLARVTNGRFKGGYTTRHYGRPQDGVRSEEHTSELQSRSDLVCRLLLEKKKNKRSTRQTWTIPSTEPPRNRTSCA